MFTQYDTLLFAFMVMAIIKWKFTNVLSNVDDASDNNDDDEYT